MSSTPNMPSLLKTFRPWVWVSDTCADLIAGRWPNTFSSSKYQAITIMLFAHVCPSSYSFRQTAHVSTLLYSIIQYGGESHCKQRWYRFSMNTNSWVWGGQAFLSNLALNLPKFFCSASWCIISCTLLLLAMISFAVINVHKKGDIQSGRRQEDQIHLHLPPSRSCHGTSYFTVCIIDYLTETQKKQEMKWSSQSLLHWWDIPRVERRAQPRTWQIGSIKHAFHINHTKDKKREITIECASVTKPPLLNICITKSTSNSLHVLAGTQSQPV